MQPTLDLLNEGLDKPVDPPRPLTEEWAESFRAYEATDVQTNVDQEIEDSIARLEADPALTSKWEHPALPAAMTHLAQKLKEDRPRPTSNHSIPEEHSDVMQSTFEWSPRLAQKLKVQYGYQFRGAQEGVINGILKGQPVFANMPTGFGKSLCYQLATLMRPSSVTLVISPLLSLITDQLQGLADKGIPALAWHSGLSGQAKFEVIQTLQAEESPRQVQFLYITPESLANQKQTAGGCFQVLQTLAANGSLKLIVIDEAHCISQWGSDFRPDYQKLGALLQDFPQVTIAAFTASGSPEVVADCLRVLKLEEKSTLIFRESFDRPNLFLEVRPKNDNTLAEIRDLVRDTCAIVYVMTQSACHTVADFLNQRLKGLAAPYHAGLSPDKRMDIHTRFRSGDLRVICATTAFGMGIDQADVRFVCHYSMPSTLDRLYQEIGRAGRDELPARSVVYYAASDYNRYLNMLTGPSFREDLKKVVNYCETRVDCRRTLLLETFGEFHAGGCSACDNCWHAFTESDKKPDETDVGHIARHIIELVQDTRTWRPTVTKIRDVLMGRKTQTKSPVNNQAFNNHRHFRLLSSWNPADVESLIRQLISQAYLKQVEGHIAVGSGRSQMYMYLQLGNPLPPQVMIHLELKPEPAPRKSGILLKKRGAPTAMGGPLKKPSVQP